MSRRPISRREREWHATGELLGTGLGALVRIVRDTHQAIDDRVGHALPDAAVPVLAVERALSSAVYILVEGAHRTVPSRVSESVAASGPPEAFPPSESAAGRTVMAAANGLWGDRIEQTHRPLAVPMSVRVDDADLALDGPSVTAAFPDATPHLVVFVHGLGEDERWWMRPHDDSGRGYPDRLSSELPLTPVLVRYNTGLAVAENGRRLSALLDDLLAAWPLPVTSVSLVGHSMGGLVVRSACSTAAAARAPWWPAADVAVTVGTPHNGAPLAAAAGSAQAWLAGLPEGEPLSRILGARSTGIADLGGRSGTPLVRDVAHRWVAGTLLAKHDHALAHLLGDGLVPVTSAHAHGHDDAHEDDLVGPDPDVDDAHVAGAGHMRLLSHPEVYRHLARWLAPQS